MKILGLDPSTKSFGFCMISGNANDPDFYVTKITPDKKFTIDERFLQIITQVNTAIATHSPELVIMEYPFNIMGNAKVLIEMFGAIRYFCLQKRIPFLPLAQTRIKKYATGAGGAEKSDMRIQAYKEFRLDLSEDEADAFWIAHMGMTYVYGSSNKNRQKSIDDMKKKESKAIKTKLKKK